jgi:flagellar protein FlaF
MGAGTVIASAIGIILLIITAYFLIGGTLSAAKTAVLAQRDASQQENQRIHTRIEIMNASANTDDKVTFIEVENTGSEVIGDFGHMEVYLFQGTQPYTYTNFSGQWNYTLQRDMVNPGLLDPDEVVNITVPYAGADPAWVKVATANGVYDSAYLPKSSP